jgi:hypothetical protein
MVVSDDDYVKQAVGNELIIVSRFKKELGGELR